MIAIDTNILVYAHRPECPFHAQAKRCVEGLARSGQPFGMPVHCLIEFVGVVSHPRVWAQPSSARDIIEQVEAWLEVPALRLLAEDAEFWGSFRDALRTARPTGGAVHDARIAACCRYHGIRELWSADRDFSRYDWLHTRNPLLEDG
ncbi:MAG: TA system VapC family ribonuclease toxin [Myxococcota bacterium]